MRIFHNTSETGYAPSRSFFNGTFKPYPDVPQRTAALLEPLVGAPGITLEEPPALDPALLASIHGDAYPAALQAVCHRLKADEQFFPLTMQRRPLLLESPFPRIRAGYYALDTSTPLVPASFTAALGAAAAAVAGADALLAGESLAYSLARPPGHHAGREYWAGYCVLNNAALAVQRLSGASGGGTSRGGRSIGGKVALLDVDFHHGNGSQDIFWERPDVLFTSLHCRPEEAYPYVSGARSETGAGKGLGSTYNFPLPSGTHWAGYAPALETALDRIAAFGPQSVVLSLGFDTWPQTLSGPLPCNRGTSSHSVPELHRLAARCWWCRRVGMT